MPENELLAEIHRVREEIARECHFKVDELMESFRLVEEEAEKNGWKMADFSAHGERREADSFVVREEPDKAREV